jgi:hypothetical protein
MDLLPRRQRHQYVLAGGVAISQPGGLGNVTIAPLVRGQVGRAGRWRLAAPWKEAGRAGALTELNLFVLVHFSCFPMLLCTCRNCPSWTFKR